jgi:mannose-6-phosphate isomerase
MAIALTPFRGFCGFLPLPQLLFLLSTIPEMKSLVGTSTLDKLASSLDLGSTEQLDLKELENTAQDSVAKDAKTVEINEAQKFALKEVFEKLMTASEEQVKSTLSSLVQRYTSEPAGTSSAEKSLIPLVLELNEQYPEDVGVLCCFVLNVVELEVGKSVFLGADEPHAYISGGESSSDREWWFGADERLTDIRVNRYRRMYGHFR